ncbi:unnamed protein product [Ambrosiozyma monospora]|uniref:Unnamed protein product n=1 Tax=Ambrosiozyma monospora TaxID=43982 RepID=A0ACB5TQ53_AMBMO|nr:unnamed protein product [Ambrosiozyma monospora]
MMNKQNLLRSFLWGGACLSLLPTTSIAQNLKINADNNILNNIKQIDNTYSLKIISDQLDQLQQQPFNNDDHHNSIGYNLASSEAEEVFLGKKPLPPSDGEEDKCPPCFNCNLPNFECTQFSTCNTNTGFCECLDGFGGLNCSQPVCGSLSQDKDKRPLRKDKPNAQCECEEGWGS